MKPDHGGGLAERAGPICESDPEPEELTHLRNVAAGRAPSHLRAFRALSRSGRASSRSGRGSNRSGRGLQSVGSGPAVGRVVGDAQIDYTKLYYLKVYRRLSCGST